MKSGEWDLVAVKKQMRSEGKGEIEGSEGRNVWRIRGQDFVKVREKGEAEGKKGRVGMWMREHEGK